MAPRNTVDGAADGRDAVIAARCRRLPNPEAGAARRHRYLSFDQREPPLR